MMDIDHSIRLTVDGNIQLRTLDKAFSIEFHEPTDSVKLSLSAVE